MAESDWLRRIAAGLVGEADADDLVQDTWISALKNPPSADKPTRPWLVRVLRNASRMRYRSQSRQIGREQTYLETKGEKVNPIERFEVQSSLAQLLLNLAEPYRSTLLARYVEELDTEDIARREGVSAGTVRWRISQGLAKLRDAMDGETGGKQWVLCLPMASSKVSTAGNVAVLGKGMSIVSYAKVMIASAVAGVALVGGFVFWAKADPVAAEKETEPLNHPASVAEQTAVAPTGPRRIHSKRRAELLQKLREAVPKNERTFDYGPRTVTGQKSVATRGPAAAGWSAPTLDKDYIRERFSEVFPLIKGCYETRLGETARSERKARRSDRDDR